MCCLAFWGIFVFFSCKRIEKEQLTFFDERMDSKKKFSFHDRAVFMLGDNIHHSLDSDIGDWCLMISLWV